MLSRLLQILYSRQLKLKSCFYAGKRSMPIKSAKIAIFNTSETGNNTFIITALYF
jgi:hypothetical protein